MSEGDDRAEVLLLETKRTALKNIRKFDEMSTIAAAEARDLEETSRTIKLLLESLQRLVQEKIHELSMMKASNTLTGKAMVSVEQIIESAIPRDDTFPGVYFLVSDGRVVYVGQSVNVFSRARDHHDVDRWAYIPCEREQLDVLESMYIHWLRPARNHCDPDGSMRAPLSMENLIQQAVEGQ